MNKKLNQSGSLVVVILLAVTVIAVAGFVGYKVANNSSTETQVSSEPASSATAAKAEIKSSADVKKAATELETTNVDTQVNPDELDSDINSIL